MPRCETAPKGQANQVLDLAEKPLGKQRVAGALVRLLKDMGHLSLCRLVAQVEDGQGLEVTSFHGHTWSG